MATYRTFIALPTSAEIKDKMALVQSDLKRTQADVKWDATNKFHITLKFLGNVNQDKLENLYHVIGNAVNQQQAFELEYNSVGVFPNMNNPRVIWIGAEPNQKLMDLQSNIQQTCMELGFPKEDRGFHPHVTLGRVRGRKNISHLTEAIKSITFEPIVFFCKELLIMKSDLKPEGSVYTVLKSFQLKV